MQIKLFIKTTLLLTFFSFPLVLKGQYPWIKAFPTIIESTRKLECEDVAITCPMYWELSQYDTLRRFALSEIKFLGAYQDTSLLSNLSLSLHKLNESMDAIGEKEVFLIYQEPGNEHHLGSEGHAQMLYYTVRSTGYNAMTFLNTYYLLKKYGKKK